MIPESPKHPEKGVRPYHVLLFTLSVFTVLLSIMLVFPKDGIKISDNFTLYFPTVADFFSTGEDKPDIDEILASMETPVDTQATTEVDTQPPPPRLNRIQYPDGDPSILYPAFRQLELAAKGKKPVRVLHYGDSQIEGDRMTSLIRARIQERFGGSGPGLTAAYPLVPSFSIRQERSEGWQRYTAFGRKDTTVKHRRYGIMATFSRFAPILPDSLLNDDQHYTGWLSLMRSGAAYNKSKVYNTLRMYYGYNRKPVNLRIFVDDAPFTEDSLPVRSGVRIKEWKFKSTPKKIMMIMNGADSPEIYGLSLENDAGVSVDNLSMRGSSGTLFGGLDYGVIKRMYDSLNVKLLLLQYGGNTVPYIKSDRGAERYGKDFGRQIAFLKKLNPEASVIVIGPADMATKVKGKFQTHPYLEKVRDALKQAAFDQGAAYFDIYEVMGGRNSMIEWVEAKPPLAGKDYVHFNQKGAKKIAEVFVKSFFDDYEAYRQTQIK